MTKEKENRFDDLMKTVRSKKNTKRTKQIEVETSNLSDVQEPKSQSAQLSEKLNISTSQHPNIQKSIAKSTNPDYTRTTIYLPKKMHKKLKAIALEEEKEMSSIVEELISAWLISNS